MDVEQITEKPLPDDKPTTLENLGATYLPPLPTMAEDYSGNIDVTNFLGRYKNKNRERVNRRPTLTYHKLRVTRQGSSVVT